MVTGPFRIADTGALLARMRRAALGAVMAGLPEYRPLRHTRHNDVEMNGR
jgi:hypothetical protein